MNSDGENRVATQGLVGTFSSDSTSPISEELTLDFICPVCGAILQIERCKVICRSNICGYRIIMTCAEF